MVQRAEGPTQPDRECPYSGETIVVCKLVDLCDCFDFPEYDDWPYDWPTRDRENPRAEQ